MQDLKHSKKNQQSTSKYNVIYDDARNLFVIETDFHGVIAFFDLLEKIAKKNNSSVFCDEISEYLN